jgi:cyanophycinase-like exopeptidase
MACFCFFNFIFLYSSSQDYTNFLTGNISDVNTQPIGGICLMGGASEDDNAMKWFLNRADGGDVLVLRTSGADGYNNYLYSSLGVPVNSVETIIFHNPSASYNNYIHDKINKAEAIWFAGGDQWQYISYWRDTPIDSLINKAIQERNIVVGGTSAGMAILGDFYFSAQFGTVLSSTALANPYNSSVTIDSASFIQHSQNFLVHTINDTHFDNPDRKGRLTVFLARIFEDFNIQSKAIACEEYCAVCIDNNGVAKVFGSYPQYEDYVYFAQVNCELLNNAPEVCIDGNALTWNQGNQALKVYKIPGTSSGNNFFNLTNWINGIGGTWYNWSVNNGVFLENVSQPLDCNLSNNNDNNLLDKVYIYLDEQLSTITLKHDIIDFSNMQLSLMNYMGQKIPFEKLIIDNHNVQLILPKSKGQFLILRLNGALDTISYKFHW